MEGEKNIQKTRFENASPVPIRKSRSLSCKIHKHPTKERIPVDMKNFHFRSPTHSNFLENSVDFSAFLGDSCDGTRLTTTYGELI